MTDIEKYYNEADIKGIALRRDDPYHPVWPDVNGQPRINESGILIPNKYFKLPSKIGKQ